MTELNEVVAEAAEEVAETAVTVAEISRRLSPREVRFLALGVSVGLAGGCVVGYFYTKRRLQKKYSDEADLEISEVREEYQDKMTKMNEDVIRLREHYNERLAAPKPELDRVMEQLGYKGDEAPVPVEEVKNYNPPQLFKDKNVFDIAREISEEDTPDEFHDVWDYALEVKSRDPEVPYVIHVDEHTQNEKSYTQAMLTYYEDDDVLADEHDHIVEDQDEIIGVHNLGKFGHGSKDPEIVYVRNDRLSIDYEIVRSTGSFAEEVHGLKHSDDPFRRPEWDG